MLDLQWRQLDDADWVVFESGSGQIHAPDALAAAVLGLVEQGVGDEAALLAELSAHWPTGAADALAADTAADAGLAPSSPQSPQLPEATRLPDGVGTALGQALQALQAVGLIVRG